MAKIWFLYFKMLHCRIIHIFSDSCLWLVAVLYNSKTHFYIATTVLVMSERLWTTTTGRCLRSIRLFVSCGGTHTGETVCERSCCFNAILWLSLHEIIIIYFTNTNYYIDVQLYWLLARGLTLSTPKAIFFFSCAFHEP